jgi:putative membrane protein
VAGGQGSGGQGPDGRGNGGQAAATHAAATHAAIARDARAIERSAAEQTDSAARTTQLAADRTILAAERTYAAWVRTGLAALAAGIGARTLLHGVVPGWLGRLAAATLVAFSAFAFVAAVWRELTPAYRDPHPETRRLPAALLLGVNGVLVLVALAAFVGVVG